MHLRIQEAKLGLTIPILHDTFQAVTMTFTGRYETKSATGITARAATSASQSASQPKILQNHPTLCARRQMSRPH